MCTEIETPMPSKVHHRGGSLRLLMSTRKAKSVIIKLKQWVKKLKNVEGAGGGQKSTKNFEGVLIERQNATNENKFNIVRSKMAYTVEELRDIVDDNLANELRETEAKSPRE